MYDLGVYMPFKLQLQGMIRVGNNPDKGNSLGKGQKIDLEITKKKKKKPPN